MDTPLYPTSGREPYTWARLFRGCVIAAAFAALALLSSKLTHVSPAATLFLLALLFLSRSVPVAISRERPITFTGAFVFADALLLNGVAAGWSAILACLVHARLFQRSGRGYSFFVGAQYALAGLAARSAYDLLSGTTQVSTRPDLRDLAALSASALVFIGANAALIALGNLGTRYANRRYVEPVLRAQAIAYIVSFPFAALMVLAYRGLGFAALPILAALLLVCAHAVRMTVENRLLVRQIAAVEKLGQTCASGVRAEVPLQRFLVLARDLVAFDRAILWVADESSMALTPRAIFPEGGLLPNPEEGGADTLVGRVSQRSKPLLIADASRDPRQPLGTPSAAWMLYPIVLHGRSIGVAQFIRSASRPFAKPEVQRLGALVPQAAVAFESVRVRQLMHRYADMATTDGLTGLLNHRRSQELLRDELRRAVRYGRPLAILMLDVDDFKSFNDRYGHPQGDALLRSMARILRNTVRNVDHVGRYGGEEFIVILPETALPEACILGERIRLAIASEWFPAGNGERVQKTVSVGIAAYPDNATDATELVQHADEALYRAKRAGRNRVLTG